MVNRRLAAILALDVCGYSRMMQSDAPGLLRALNFVFRSIVQPAVGAAGGRVVKLMGDGALIEFPSAAQALSCAISIQQTMRGPESACDYPEAIVLRAGLHAGDVIVDGEDIFGDGVNVATRLQAIAPPGGILASRMLCDLAGSDAKVKLQREGLRQLKNLAQPIEVLSVNLADPNVDAKRRNFAAMQEIRFCSTKDNVRLAWTSVGEGAPIVKAPNWIGHLELDWRMPGLAHLYESLASRRRLVRFDARGNGLSDWDVDQISFERFVEDLETVFDAAAIDRAPILAISQGCAVAAAYAARSPERVSAIVMIGGFALGRARRKSAKDRARAEAMKAMMTAGWDDDYPSLRDLMAQVIVPTASEEARRQFADNMRDIISPENIGRYREVVDQIDVTGLLARVTAPCLVLHSKGDRMQPIEQGRLMAAGLPNSRFIACDSENHEPLEQDPAWPLIEREIHGFLETHG